MKKDFMRWAVGLLAGSALVVAGCGGSGNKSGEGERETGAFRTPTQERQQPPSDDEAKPLARERPSHPATGDQESAGGNLPRGTPLGGGTAGPNASMRQEAAGLLPRGGMGTGLGANLADVYQAPQPQGDTATGGAGTEGQTQAGSAAPSGPAGSSTGAGGGSGGGGGAGGGGAGGGSGGSGGGGSGGAGGAGATSDDGTIEGGSGGGQGGQ
ncbi:MAG TPA: hypothetical protein VE153_39860 [Myxococcus sp.]|nr:hypothetical protein [Myxococcus sp.]